MEKPNKEYINQIAEGDEVFKEQFIATIKKQLPLDIALYKYNLQQDNFKLAAGNVHKLKHVISILGLVKSYLVAEQYEHNLKVDSVILKSEFEEILISMQDFINHI
jgi:hypothetical protein